MSVVDLKENELLARSGDVAQETGNTGWAERVFTLQIGLTAEPKKAIIDVYGHADLPQLWDRHPHIDALYVWQRDATVKGNTITVIVRYKSYEARTVDNPLDEPAKVSYSFNAAEEQIDHDINDKEITNSAGELFDPPVTKEFYDLLIRVSKNQQDYSANDAANYIGRINSGSFRGFSEGQVMCTMYDGVEERFADLVYYAVAFEFRVRKDGWKKRILDQGFRKKTGNTDTDGSPELEEKTDKNENKVSEPVLLDGQGGFLAEGGDPVFLEFDIYDSVSFDPLGIS